MAEDTLGHEMVQEILWELSELNFRCKLAALVHLVVLHGLEEQKVDAMLLKCVPGGSYALADISLANRGLAAASIQDPVPFLKWFLDIFACGSLLKNLQCLAGICSEDEIKCFESQLLRTCTQTFFNYFGCPPTIPCRLDHLL